MARQFVTYKRVVVLAVLVVAFVICAGFGSTAFASTHSEAYSQAKSNSVDISGNREQQRLARMANYIEQLRSLVIELLKLRQMYATAEQEEARAENDGTTTITTFDTLPEFPDESQSQNTDSLRYDRDVDRADAQEAIDDANDRINDVDNDIAAVGTNADAPVATERLGDALAQLAEAEAAFADGDYVRAVELAEFAIVLADQAADLL